MRKFFRSQRIERGLRVAAIFTVMLIGYGVLRTIGPLRHAISRVEYGVVVLGTGVGNVIGRVFTSNDAVTTKFATCQAQLMDATIAIAALTSQADDVTELQQLIGYTPETSTQTIPARIILRSLPDAGTVTIDKGTRDGIRQGDAVVVGDGHLLGQISRVNESAATVRLIHNEASKIPSAILGRERTIGLVEGQGGTLLHMDYIPEGTNIDTGDVVATSGLDAALPPNLVIGVVTEIIREDTAPFLQALIEPLYDAREWTNVLVIGIVPDGV